MNVISSTKSPEAKSISIDDVAGIDAEDILALALSEARETRNSIYGYRFHWNSDHDSVLVVLEIS